MDRCINNVIPQREKRRQVGLEDAAAQFLRRRANAIDGAQDVFRQYIDVPGAAISQFSFWPTTRLLRRGSVPEHRQESTRDAIGDVGVAVVRPGLPGGWTTGPAAR